MKLKFTLYGCATHFDTMDAQGQRIALGEMKEVFANRFTKAVSEDIEAPTVEIDIRQETVPIPRTFVADVALDSEKRKFDSQKLEEIAVSLGDAWVEFVRAFIDSGALIAIRVATEDSQVRWSPH